MSYILDALKRAEAERARGTVPGLHAQSVATAAAPPVAARSSLWLAMAAVLALAGTVTGVALLRAPAAIEPVHAAMAVPAEAPASGSAPSAHPDAVPTQAALPAPPAVPRTPAAPTPAAAKRPPPPAVATVAAKAGDDQRSGANAPLRSELPESLRREIPALTITGAVDSANPAQRLLLVNGQVLPQGGSPAAEVTLLEIKAQSSLFSFRGTQFRVAH